MANFIIYEKQVDFREEYEIAILNFLGCREEKFKMFDYDSFVGDKHDRNIYIISSEDDCELLRIASDIRKDDWFSQIIFVGSFKNTDVSFYKNKLLILDYIEKDDKVSDNLKSAFFTSYGILSKDKTLSFALNAEIYRIPYNDILYIEKSNNQNFCVIHTENNEYNIKDTINNLEEILDPAFFMKTHRSCIVNLSAIRCYNCSENTIYFEDKSTDMISREKRNILKFRLIDEKISY